MQDLSIFAKILLSTFSANHFLHDYVKGSFMHFFTQEQTTFFKILQNFETFACLAGLAHWGQQSPSAQTSRIYILTYFP